MRLSMMSLSLMTLIEKAEHCYAMLSVIYDDSHIIAIYAE